MMQPKPSYHKIHKYKRKNMTRTKGKQAYPVYVCTLPGCSHYIRCDLSFNKESICNRCDKPFLMNARSMAESKPHCNDCVKKKNITIERDETMDKFLGELGLD